MKAVVASLVFLTILGGEARAYSNFAELLFSEQTHVSNHVDDEDFGDEFKLNRR